MDVSEDEIASEPGPAKRWERRKEARPAEIVAAALDCFAERGFAGTRLDDVAARAGVTKGTVYLYFSNKEQLFKAMVRQSLLPHLERMTGDLTTAPEDPVERLRRLPVFFAREVLNTRLAVIPKLIIAEAENFPEIARFYLEEVINRGRGFVTDAIRQGIERGIFRPVNPDQAVFSLIGPMLLAAIWQRSLGLYDSRPLDGAALIHDHFELFLRGIAAEAHIAGQDGRKP